MPSIIDRYYRLIRPFRFLYGWAKDARTRAQCSARAEDWKRKGFQGAKLDICGGRNPYKPGEYLNVDQVPFPQVDLAFDITKTFPIPSNVIDEIVSFATLEHLHKEEGEHVLRECLRVLRPGGVMRVVTPDIEAIARLVLADGNINVINQHLFGKFKSKETELPDLHKWLLPAQGMMDLLEKIGFVHATRLHLDLPLHDPQLNYLIRAEKPE
ncbi:MAG: methyltransferase domain-containing protein [Candidatus Peregrinibacteria bacterium]